MQKITREAIRQLAASDVVYFRGMRYYAAHAVSNVTWNETSRQYKATVMGNHLYTVTASRLDDGEYVYSCNCPSNIKGHGACKHVVATLLFIADYQQRETVMETSDDTAQKAYNIVEYFRKQEYRRLTPRYFGIELTINLKGMFKDKSDRVNVEMHAGCGKMYKVANIKKFVKDYYERNEIRLGKEFIYIPGECAFEEYSEGVLSYFCEIYELQEMLGRSYYSNIFTRSEIIMSQKMFEKLLKLSVGISCNLNLYGHEIKNVEIVNGNPDLSVALALKEDVIELRNTSTGSLISLCADGAILYYNGKIFLPEEEFICNLLPLYSELFCSEQKQIGFSGENKNAFIEKVLPVIKKTMSVSVPQEIRDRYVVETLIPKLYLDIKLLRKKSYVSAVIKFSYGAYEINPLCPATDYSCILVRDLEEEERLLKLLYELKFSVSDNEFILKREGDIYDLMTQNGEILNDNFEVYYSKEYKKMSVRKMGRFSASIRLNTDINLLEMDLDYTGMPKDELEAFFQAIRLKKKYFRMKNGMFIGLSPDNNNVANMRWLLENGKTSQNGKITFAKTTAFYLEHMFSKNNHIQKETSFNKLVDDLSHPENKSYKIPDGINAVLRPYQVLGYRWLRVLAEYGLGGILADDMGLGKTLQAILFIVGMHEDMQGKKSLIVCPTSLAYNWQEEFERFAPGIKICVVFGSPEERSSCYENMEGYDVMITTYPLIRKDIKQITKYCTFDNMFIDEAQFIKNPASIAAKAVKAVSATNRFALTGTPIENSLSELWSIFDFIMPGFFQKYSRFSEKYEKPILREKNEMRMRELKMRIKPFILRRMKKDVLKELPDKIETNRMAEMTIKQKKIYRSYLSRIQTELRDKDILDGNTGQIQVLSALTRLRQICCDPSTFVENYHGGSGKLELLMEHLPDILRGGHSVIIFSQFTTMLSIIAGRLREEGIAFYYLSGTTKINERKQFVRGFNRGDVNVFLISLKAGGTGLNLTGADTVIHFDPWWNPAVEQQATDRAYRIGQKKKVQVYRYVMKDSIEEKIYELQKRKKQLFDNVIQSEEMFINNLTIEELKNLFME